MLDRFVLEMKGEVVGDCPRATLLLLLFLPFLTTFLILKPQGTDLEISWSSVLVSFIKHGTLALASGLGLTTVADDAPRRLLELPRWPDAPPFLGPMSD
jgi:hypothetical protein